MINKILFSSVLMSGSFIAMSSTTWLPAWIGLEMNLLGFIPLIFSQKNLRNNEAMLKYFLTQAFASSILLFGIMSSFIILNYSTMPLFPENFIITTALAMKLGAAPFHFWFPPVLEGMSWANSCLLMTWQKLAPLFLMFSNMSQMMIFLIIFSSIVGALGGLNQTLTRKILAYSSINHLGWVIMAFYLSKSLLINYFLIYSILVTIMIFMFYTTNSSHINQIPGFTIYPKISSAFALNLLSLGGLPPFLGFLPKWLLIQAIIFYSPLIASILIFTALITLFYYLRISYTILLKSFSMNPFIYSPPSVALVTLTSISSLSLMLAMPVLS